MSNLSAVFGKQVGRKTPQVGPQQFGDGDPQYIAERVETVVPWSRTVLLPSGNRGNANVQRCSKIRLTEALIHPQAANASTQTLPN